MSQTLLVARVRLLWRKYQKLDLPSSSETKPELPVKSTEAVLNGWSQVFPRKLTPQEVREMKQRFKVSLRASVAREHARASSFVTRVQASE